LTDNLLALVNDRTEDFVSDQRSLLLIHRWYWIMVACPCC